MKLEDAEWSTHENIWALDHGLAKDIVREEKVSYRVAFAVEADVANFRRKEAIFCGGENQWVGAGYGVTHVTHSSKYIIAQNVPS